LIYCTLFDIYILISGANIREIGTDMNWYGIAYASGHNREKNTSKSKHDSNYIYIYMGKET